MLNLQGHKSNDMLSLPLDIPDVAVLQVRQEQRGDYIITVTSTREGTRCQYCGRKLMQLHGHARWIKLRHLPILGHRVYLRLRPKQYVCPDCGDKITTQQPDWYAAKSTHTQAYDKYLMLSLVNSTVKDVSRKEAVGYDAAKGAVQRCISTRVDWDEFDELGVIGIDEIALLKGRKDYVAIITSQQAAGRVVVLAVLADRKKETVRQFMESIPRRLWPTMATVCTDMWDGYGNAAKEFAAAHPEVTLEVVTDRYHGAKHYRDGVDTLRKSECRRLKKELPKAEYEAVKGMMWIVRQNHRDLTPDERARLRTLFRHAPRLKTAYTFREELTAIFEMSLTKAQAQTRLRKWAAKVRRSGLTGFAAFLKTLDNWFEEITNYFHDRLSSGFVEGLNNKIKTLKRRCYGIRSITTLFQRLYIDLEGYRLFALYTP
ncbi:MAG: ISL3 family transposase [Anaerolineales bacterium]|nr:ISL3 family transposase [Anaerolineales bacterium]